MKKFLGILVFILMYVSVFAQSQPISETPKLKLKQFASGSKGVAESLNWNLYVTDTAYSGTNSRLNTNITGLRLANDNINTIQTTVNSQGLRLSNLEYNPSMSNVTISSSLVYSPETRVTLPLFSGSFWDKQLGVKVNSSTIPNETYLVLGQASGQDTLVSRRYLRREFKYQLHKRLVFLDSKTGSSLTMPKYGSFGLPANITDQPDILILGFLKQSGDEDLIFTSKVTLNIGQLPAISWDYRQIIIRIDGTPIETYNLSTFESGKITITADLTGISDGLHELFIEWNIRPTGFSGATIDNYLQYPIVEINGTY